MVCACKFWFVKFTAKKWRPNCCCPIIQVQLEAFAKPLSDSEENSQSEHWSWPPKKHGILWGFAVPLKFLWGKQPMKPQDSETWLFLNLGHAHGWISHDFSSFLTVQHVNPQCKRPASIHIVTKLVSVCGVISSIAGYYRVLLPGNAQHVIPRCHPQVSRIVYCITKTWR